MTANRYAIWFGRALWLGILVNLGFAIPALFFPSVFTTEVGLGGLRRRGSGCATPACSWCCCVGSTL